MVTPLRAAEAVAVQISESPDCPLALVTSDQLNPAPLTMLVCFPAPKGPDVPTKAINVSFPVVVNGGLLIDGLVVVLSADTVASTARTAAVTVEPGVVVFRCTIRSRTSRTYVTVVPSVRVVLMCRSVLS